MNKFIYIKTALCILAGSLVAAHVQAQHQPDQLQAAQVVKPDSLGKDIYQLLTAYRLLLVGETHGTNESAAFVNGLMITMLKHGDSVQIGLEIKASQMNHLNGTQNDSALLRSCFFSKEKHNPQSSEAWAKLLLSAQKNQVNFFFFDAEYNAFNNLYPRDSAMYLNIQQKIKEHPSWKTIILSGNIHSSPSLYNNIPTLGYYLSTDTLTAAVSSIISIVHRYKTGELWDTSGPLPQEYEKRYEELPYTETLGLKNYLLILPGKANGTVRAIYYTEKATRSRIIWND